MNINQVAADLEMIGCTVRNLSITNDLISIRDDDELHLDLDIIPACTLTLREKKKQIKKLKSR